MLTRPGRSRLARLTSLGLLAAVLCAGVLVVAPPRAADAKEWDSEKDNVILAVPDSPYPWEWLSVDNSWAKLGIVRGAKRTLTKLKRTGDPATGQGALMHLAVRKVEGDMTLAAAAEEDKVRDFLLKRFKGTEGEVESEEITVESGSSREGHPAIVLRAEGTANNLKAKTGPCTGYLIITIAKGKLYLLRLYAFPTEADDDGLVYDIDYLEGNCLRLINTKEKKVSKGPPKKADGDAKEGEAPAEEDEREDKEIINRAQRWRIVLDKKLKPLEISEDEKKDFLEIKCVDADQKGGYSFYVYAPPTVQYIDGVQGPPPNLIKWITKDWWQNFTVNHPKGDLITYKWPKKPMTKGKTTFMTLPYFDDPKARKVVIKEGKKRPVEVDAADMMKKLGFTEKVKKKKIGKKGSVSEAVRGVMSGKRPRFPGYETIVRFAFRGRAHSYRVFVSFWGEAHKKWGESLRKTLESWEFGLKFRD